LEACLYLVCMNFILEGCSLPAESGMYIALTGYVFTGMALSYTTFLRGGKVFQSMHFETVSQLLGVYFASLLAPGAVLFQSQLLGWGAICSIYYALGFGIQCRGLCWVIGWSDENAMLRSICASFIMMGASVSYTIYGGDDMRFIPFSTASTVFGSIVSNLGMLILSSKWLRIPSITYWKQNVLNIGLMLGSSAIGNIFGIPGLANTATTFLVMYCMEKYVEWYVEMEWNGWVLTLSVSCMIYKSALWLHQHPAFVASLFDFGARTLTNH